MFEQSTRKLLKFYHVQCFTLRCAASVSQRQTDDVALSAVHALHVYSQCREALQMH